MPLTSFFKLEAIILKVCHINSLKYLAKEMNSSEKYQLIPACMARLLGIFIPFMIELYEMRYQFDRTYFFDSSKFETYFKFTPTTYADGEKQIVSEG